MNIKHYLQILFLPIVAWLAIACNPDDKHENNTPSIEIYDVSFKDGSAMVSVKTENIEYLAYGYAVSNSGIEHYETLTPESDLIIEISGLTEATEYRLLLKGGNSYAEVQETYKFALPYTGKAYKKRLLVTKFSGTRCGYCPQATATLDAIKEEFPDRFVTNTMHIGDDFSISVIDILTEYFGISGVPTLVIDYTYKIKGTAPKDTVTALMDRAEASNPAFAGIGISSKLTGNNLTVSVDVEAGIAGNYRLCCLVMEDGIYAPGTIGSIDGYYSHVTRKFLTDPRGDDIETITGEVKEFTFSTELIDYWKAENCSVMAYVLRKKGSKYEVVNSITASLNTTADIQ